MVARKTASLDEAERQIEDRILNLIQEFQNHFDEYVRQHPGRVGQKTGDFRSWAIQKIAGLQLSVEHVAEQLNRHVAGKNKP